MPIFLERNLFPETTFLILLFLSNYINYNKSLSLGTGAWLQNFEYHCATMIVAFKVP